MWKVSGLCACLVAFASTASAKDHVGSPASVQVMIVGTFHFDNPGLDYRNMEVDDVLKPARQKEIAEVVNALARFAPTVVGVEWQAEPAATAYEQYKDGTLPPRRDETVQLGFALAKHEELATVYGLDMPMSLPFDPVFAFAQKNGRQPIIDRITTVSDQNVAAQEETLKKKGIAATLRLLNDPVAADRTHGLYREILKLGVGSDQPGFEATTTWYRRNLGICAKLLQAAKPGDRVIAFFGGGHLTLLQQCVRETPGYELVDARSYLPR